MNMNDCLFVGNLTRDPELKQTKSGTPVVTFSLAINAWRGKDKPAEVSYLDFEAWDTGAEYIANNGKKGDQMFVKCLAKQDRWKNAEGEGRSKILFRVNEFLFLRRKDKVAEVQVKTSEAEPQKENDDDSNPPF